MNSMYKKDLEFSKEGSIYFWLKSNSVDYASNMHDDIAEFFSDDGRVNIYKDEKNNLIAKFEASGIIKDDVSVTVSSLQNNERHMILFMWSIKEKFIELSVDANEQLRNRNPLKRT